MKAQMNLNSWWEQIRIWFETYETLWTWLGFLSVLTLIGTLISVLLVLILLPRDYLTQDKVPTRDWPSPLRIPYLIVKNVFGGLLILAGLAMLLLPGQGLLTLFVGIVLVDLPGKRRLIHRIVQHQKVLTSINWLRVKARKPPLEKPE